MKVGFMRIDLAGEWKLRMEQDEYETGLPEPTAGRITLPGSLQAAGYGYPVDADTEWVSGLHNPFWHEREEYSHCSERSNCSVEEIYRVPFLSQPVRHFIGKAWYEREFAVTKEMAGEKCWTLFIECTKWRSEVYVDGVRTGGDCSLCAPHEIVCGSLSEGLHTIKICIDNSMQYPYRPDAHSVSDAMGATWNGMAGEIALLSDEELAKRKAAREEYAKAHPRVMEVRDGRFFVDGRAEYFRGTHFAGDYPLTGFPETGRAWWDNIMKTVRRWGLNFIRCHSYCPPEAAFQAADEAGVYLQPECGMWNIFNTDNQEMTEVLEAETVRILKHFGHHPSFVLFSPSNEPGGEWYTPLKKWVRIARGTDRELGYEGRRLYTAQSGWFYDVPPAEITREDTDYLYFHRSAYGPIFGGNIRGYAGWKGRDYNPSLKGAGLPAICHELGQWCAYPDFDRVIPKYSGFLRPGNFELFKENARARGVLPYVKDFAWCSGRSQLRMYKEDIEANLRTDHLYGFELLDLHDYTGQGTALVGLLDAFWEEKGAVSAEEFREFCGETVLLTRLSSYTYKSSETLVTPVDICHFGREDLRGGRIVWRLRDADAKGKEPYASGSFYSERIPAGENTLAGTIAQSLDDVCNCAGANVHCVLELELTAENLSGIVRNHWDIYVYREDCEEDEVQVLDTHSFAQAKQALEAGQTVIFRPWLSDLDYDCPPVSFRNSFWNDQMGPNWIRGAGLSIKEAHPIFREFATDHDGGWQWEEITDYARGFGLKDYSGHQPLVRVIDEWNRNLPMGIVLEAKVLNGRMLLVSADLETDAERRPAARALNRAIIRYAERGDYVEAQTLPIEAVESRLLPLNRSMEKIAGIRMEKEPEFPISVIMKLKEPMPVRGIYYVPPQKDRMFEGCIRDYELECQTENGWEKVLAGTFENSLFGQKALLAAGKPIMASALRLRVFSCYGQGEKTVWVEAEDGWHRTRQMARPQVQFEALHVICDGECQQGEGDNKRFWQGNRRSTTREIEEA